MAGRRLTHEDVKKFFNSKGCTLLTEIYKNRSQLLEFKCYCGRLGEKSYDNFRNASRCPACSNESRVRGLLKHTESKKHSLKDVLDLCEELGIKCIGNHFESVKTPMTFICTSCKQKYKRTFENLKERQLTICRTCGLKNGQKKLAYTFEYVKDFVEKNSDSVLLSKKYINTDEKLLFKCGCGEEFEATFYKFRKNFKRQCNYCGYEDHIKSQLIPEDTIRDMAESIGYKLVKREHCHRRKINELTLICDEGHEYATSYYNFYGGRRCTKCNQSSGEKVISEVLEKYQIKNEAEYTFSNLFGLGGGLLRFDFVTFKDNGDIDFLIEFDGKQHFEPVEIMGGQERFEIVQAHDKRKNTYCEKNNIKLIRIPYWDLRHVEKILIEKMSLETASERRLDICEQKKE